MTKTFICLFLLTAAILCSDVKGQSTTSIELPAVNSLKDISWKDAGMGSLGVISILFPLNPIFLIEDKKFYVGITKEFSLGKFPYGRFAVEYSLIFRKTRLNHLRTSYNYDIPIETGDIAVVMLSAGAGYFTDFDKQGWFPQASFSILIPADNNIGVSAYFKVRNTFMNDKTKSDIFDISLGLATSFYF